MPVPGHAPRLIEIFSEAVELTSPAERGAYLDLACGGDLALRCRVEGLLGAHALADSFLESPAPAPTVVEEPGGRLAYEPSGATIGPYTLREPIGEGGMGVVFVAEQTQPMRRKVALKIIKPGMDTKQVVARFEAERQALAMMDHPNIAKVLDAGTTTGGRPLLRDGAGPRPARSPSTATASSSLSPNGWSCSFSFAGPCSTRTRRGSSIATSSRRTCWSRCTTVCRSPR